MISIGENAIDTVSTALLEGDMEFFIDQLPTSDKYKTDPLTLNKVENYRNVLRDILTRTDALTGKTNIARDELRTVYEYTVGKIPESPNKFTSLLKHHRIHTKKVWLHGEQKDGKVIFSADSDAILTKGIIAILIRVFSHQKAADILEANTDFIDQIGLKEHLSPTRANGLVSMVKQIKMYALAFQSQK